MRLEAGALPAELYFNAEMIEGSTIFIDLTEDGVPSLGMKRGAALEANAKKQRGADLPVRAGFVYPLLTEDGSKSYIGATYDVMQRLRRHNGHLSGGARYTKRKDKGSWRVACHVRFPCLKIARSFEQFAHLSSCGRKKAILQRSGSHCAASLLWRRRGRPLKNSSPESLIFVFSTGRSKSLSPQWCGHWKL